MVTTANSIAGRSQRPTQQGNTPWVVLVLAILAVNLLMNSSRIVLRPPQLTIYNDAQNKSFSIQSEVNKLSFAANDSSNGQSSREIVPPSTAPLGPMSDNTRNISAPLVLLGNTPVTTRDRTTAPEYSPQNEIPMATTKGLVRGVVLYLPKESIMDAVKRNTNSFYLKQTNWFLRSWVETLQYVVNPSDRIDVLIVVTNDTTSHAADFLKRWDCQPTLRMDHTQPSACRLVSGYTPLHDRDKDIEPLRTYKFANSIDCLLHAASVGALDHYHVLLRSDLDTFLTPYFATWNPDKFVVGKGAFCFPQFDTCERLHQIADKMGWHPPNASAVVDNVGSTWYGDQKTMIECTQVAMDVMRHLWLNEFNETERRPPGGWPHWHFGVISLYGGNIAINHCTREVGFEKRADLLDFPSSSSQHTWKAAHIHTWQERGNPTFSKYSFNDGKYNDVNITNLDVNITKEYAMYMALDGNTAWSPRRALVGAP